MNSTTIHRSSSGYPDTGIHLTVGKYGPSMPGVPTDLLTGNYGGGDYAGTYIDAATVVSFPNTDLVITQPTPFDIWMRIGIYTETPNASLHSLGNFSTWPATVCGTYSTYTEYSFTSWTVNTGSTESVHVSTLATATHSQLQPSDPLNSLRFHGGDSGNYTDRLATLNATYIQAKSTQFTEERLQVALPTDILDWLATQEEVTKKYPYIKNCWLGPKGTGQPTVHVPVMALTVTSSTFLDSPETPAVKPADKGSTSVTTRSAIHTIVTVMTSIASSDASTTALVESKQSSPDAAGPESTEEPQSEVEEPESDAVDADSSPTAQADTEEQSQDPEAEDSSLTSETASGQPTASEDHSTSSVHKGVISAPVGSATTTQPKTTAILTTGFVEGVMSVIRSVAAQQGEVSQAEPSSEDSQQTTEAEPLAVIPAAVSEERPAESVTGFAIGTQTASPGGEAVTRGGSVYSALPSGSGLRVEADGQTSTIADAVVFPEVAVAQHPGSDNNYVIGDNTLTAGGPAITSDGNTMSALPAGSGVRIAANGQTTIVPAAASTDSVTLRPGNSEDEYIFAGNSLSAGEDAVGFAGVTYSVLKSGSGIIVMAEDSTSTLSVGQVISASFASESDLDSPSPLLLPAGSQQLVSNSVNIYTASAISNASDEASDTIDTATATNSAQETHTSSSTHRLGDAIISGVGGGNADDGNGDGNNPDPQASTDVEAASHATRRSVHALFGGLCSLAFALALL